MSLSQDPAFTALKKFFICGVKDITDAPYAGMSGKHEKFGNAVNTTNGAGPHNLQMFILSSDGTVLECLPGFWCATDLFTEMRFANKLNKIWLDPSLNSTQKDELFKQMNLEHIVEHPPGMVRRSHMQGFDEKYEAEHRLTTSDAIADPALISQQMLEPGGPGLPQEAFKTTDVLMHERMAARPFVPFDHFDVASFVEYGRPRYDKEEDARNPDGSVNPELAREAPTLGFPKDAMTAPATRRRPWLWSGGSEAAPPLRQGSFSAGAHQPDSSGNAHNSVKNYSWPQ